MSMKKYIITANNLRDGLNVYFSGKEKSRWLQDLSQASVFEETELEDALKGAKEDMAKNIVVDCYSVEVDENTQPLTMREKIRAQGPSSAYGHDVG